MGKFDLQLLSQGGSTYNCLSRSVPEVHSHVAGTLSNQPTNQLWLCGKASSSRAVDLGLAPGKAVTGMTRPGKRSTAKEGIRVSAGTGWPGVSILRQGETESMSCSFCLSVAARPGQICP